MDRTLVLNPDIKTSCGCGNATLSRTALEPGQQALLKLDIKTPHFATEKLSISALVGVIEPPGIPPVRCAVTFHSIPQWEVRPTRLRLSGCVGSTAEAEFTVDANSEVQFSEHSVEVDTDACSVTRLGDLAEGNRARYRLQCELPGTPEVLNTFVRVRMPSADIVEFNLPIEIESTSRYRISPAELLLTSAASHRRTLVVRSDEAFSVLVDESLSTVRLHNSSVSALDGGKANHVELLLCPDALMPDQDRGVLRLKLVGPDGEATLQVPVFRSPIIE